RPYQKLLDQQQYEELLSSYLDPDSVFNINILRPRKIKIKEIKIDDSQIIDSKIDDSQIIDSKINDSQIIDSKIVDSKTDDSQIIDSKIVDSNMSLIVLKWIDKVVS
ncbi:11814_t:CDS:2, partial [Rhizophagus irregularis]